jgi:two-component system sensor histidine kinase KdpD
VGSRCEIWLKNEHGKTELSVSAGAAFAPAPKGYDMLIRSGAAAVGILKVFLPAPQVLDQSQQLLLNAMATQAASAIERARLSQEATRAGVLAESDRLKTALLSSVSHDLRTPLATIKAAVTSLLQRDVQWDEEAMLDQLNAINEESDRLNQIIGNLLSMSRIEAGALRLQKREYALSEVINSILSRLAPRTQSHTVHVAIPPDLPLVPLDYVSFEQIITNLVDNAVKYSPPHTEILIEARTVGSFVEIGVSDQGRGIPAEAQQAVFEKFYRASGGSYVPGSGLGLSIVKGFVEAHGGHAWIGSRAGGGTSVKFLLPLEAEASPTDV